MNWSQFKDPVSHMCLAGTVVVPWSLTQELAGSNPFTVRTIILSLNSVKTFRENSIDHLSTCERILLRGSVRKIRLQSSCSQFR